MDDKAGRGTWICSHCDPQAGDGLDLVCRVTNKSAKDAAELIAPLVGLSADGLEPAERGRIYQQQQAKAGAERKRAEQQRQKAILRAAAIIADCKQATPPI
ncbi:primase-helicase zinc-binding domain-containing protein [Aeromonas hydrophila]|uniref:primase-helicase zinc-binding domain-containing protein n=1 Tax=Aeromonas hydrophila TaxID=644 RepID=UPI0039776876